MSAAHWRQYQTCRLAEWHDADTVGVVIYQTVGFDLGFGFKNTMNTEVRISARLFGISAPEVRGQEAEMGLESRDVVRKLFLPGMALTAWTLKESFTRWVSRLIADDGRDIGCEIIGAGLALAWDGVTERPTFGVFPIKDTKAELARYAELVARHFKPIQCPEDNPLIASVAGNHPAKDKKE